MFRIDFRYDLDQLTKMFPDRQHKGDTIWKGDPFGDFELFTIGFRVFYKFKEGKLVSIRGSGVKDDYTNRYNLIIMSGKGELEERNPGILADIRVASELSYFKSEYAKMKRENGG